MLDSDDVAAGQQRRWASGSVRLVRSGYDVEQGNGFSFDVGLTSLAGMLAIEAVVTDAAGVEVERSPVVVGPYTWEAMSPTGPPVPPDPGPSMEPLPPGVFSLVFEARTPLGVFIAATAPVALWVVDLVLSTAVGALPGAPRGGVPSE